MTDSGRSSEQHRFLRERLGTWIGPALFVLILLLPAPEGLSVAAWQTAGIGLWMAVWWMSEAVPIPITSLLPLILFPLLDIAPIREAASPYAKAP